VALPLHGNVKLIGDASSLAQGFIDLGFQLSTSEQDYDLLIDTNHTKELRTALENGIPYVTTLESAKWLLLALKAAQQQETKVQALQG
jgi:carbamoyl-phosphate synthase large subunit